jgi:hypothetical protein
MGAQIKKQGWWQGCSTDEVEQPATSPGRPETVLATEVVETPLTSPSIALATPATLVACRRRQNKQRQSRKLVTIRSIDWKLVDSVFEPLHERFDFTLEENETTLKLLTTCTVCSNLQQVPYAPVAVSF